MSKRRIVVQGDGPWGLPPGHPALQGRICKPPGTISLEEHERAWQEYARRYGRIQSAERIAERGGFSWLELCDLLGGEPSTWRKQK